MLAALLPADRVAALRVGVLADPPVDQAGGRVAQGDDRRAEVDHGAEVAAGDGTDRAGECAPSRLRE